jgi:hypothetical protein
MIVDDWIQSRRDDWQRLASLLDRVQVGNLRSLSEAELAQIGDLYRQVTSDLAVARRDYPRHQVVVYLNQLTGRAHSLVYRGEPLELRRVWRFFAYTFPRLYRETGRYTLVAMLLFVIPALTTFFITWAEPDAAYTILPPGYERIIGLVTSPRGSVLSPRPLSCVTTSRWPSWPLPVACCLACRPSM